MTERTKAHTWWIEVRERLLLYLFVGVGTAIGGTAWAVASIAALQVAGDGFPWGTLIVNVAGSFAIGVFATLSAPEGRLFVSARLRQFVMTGLCGGFTTFSVFSLETVRFAAVGNYPLAGFNIAASVATWLAAVWIGHAVAARINKLGG